MTAATPTARCPPLTNTGMLQGVQVCSGQLGGRSLLLQPLPQHRRIAAIAHCCQLSTP
jgi:hypothetical protein